MGDDTSGSRRRLAGQGWLVRTLITALLTMTATQAVRPMVSYRALELGASPFQLGVVAASYALLSFLFAAALGRWIDRIGEPPFLILGTVTTTLTALLLSSVATIGAVIVAQAVLGLGQVLGLVALQTLVANGGPKAGRDGRFGALTVIASISQTLGPTTGGFLYDAAGLASTQIFLLASIPGLVAVALAATLWARPPTHVPSAGIARSPQEPLLRSVGTVMRQPSVPHAMVASLTVLTSIDLLIAYLPAYGEANGIGASTIGLMLGARAAGGLASRTLMLALLRRWTRQQLLVWGTLAPAVALLLLPFPGTEWILIVLLAIAGFGLGLGQPLSMAWVADQVPRTIRGTALGVRITGNRMAQFVVPIAAGAIAGATGIGAIFVISGASLGLSSWVVTRAPG